MSLGGAQPKASVELKNGKLAITSTGGSYILKPSTDAHPFISENEHFCMMVVQSLGLPTAPFCLITLQDGEYAFLTKRFDREILAERKLQKRHIEDFASVLAYPADSKYASDYAHVLQAASTYCRDSGLERLRIFTLIVLSYVLGNNDLHLKNFSLLDCQTHYELSPVYDVVCAMSYYPHMRELALDLVHGYVGGLSSQGFLTQKDFLYLAHSGNIEERQARKTIENILAKEGFVLSLLFRSFLPKDTQKQVKDIIQRQFAKLRVCER